MQSNIKKNIELLLNIIYSKKISHNIGPTPNFSDEPNVFFYSALIKSPFKTLENNGMVETAGLSFASKELALIKCLGESIERYCFLNYKYHSRIYKSFDQIKECALDPATIKGSHSREKNMFWVEGFNLTKKTKCYIPSQLILENSKGEFHLSQPDITTGAAGGFDHTSTLLRGIYEVIERDAFMTIFLNKINAPMINLKKLDNKYVAKILKLVERYNLQLNVFDISNDLKIPVFLNILTDKTGIGPAIACGLSSGLKVNEAIIGSITESFITRVWIRKKLIEINYKIPDIKPEKINTFTQRALYWSSINKFKELDFLLFQKPFLVPKNTFSGSKEKELLSVIEMLGKKGHDVYYVDITHSKIKKSGYRVYKIIIPTLQPLYLNESEKKGCIREKRLKEVLSFFGKKKGYINTTPHPFM